MSSPSPQLFLSNIINRFLSLLSSFIFVPFFLPSREPIKQEEFSSLFYRLVDRVFRLNWSRPISLDDIYIQFYGTAELIEIKS